MKTKCRLVMVPTDSIIEPSEKYIVQKQVRVLFFSFWKTIYETSISWMAVNKFKDTVEGIVEKPSKKRQKARSRVMYESYIKSNKKHA